jgi:hypothetical protein
MELFVGNLEHSTRYHVPSTNPPLHVNMKTEYRCFSERTYYG